MSTLEATVESDVEPVRIFIGSGEASVLERKVLMYSLHKHSTRRMDIRVFNGTHNTIEHAGGFDPAPLSLRTKYRSGDTEFGLYRYLMPELCGRAGRALYLDSDIVCLSDIGVLFDSPLDGADFAGMPFTTANNERRWTTAVMLVDCERLEFDLELIFDEIDRGLYDQGDFMQISPRFLATHPYRVGTFNPAWNSLDTADHDTKMIHFTNMYTQPWKHRNHAFGAIWFQYFREALAAGWVTEADIETALRRSYVRSDLRRAFGSRERMLSRLQRLRLP